ncbi:hypothetical protein [Mycobacteroides salmoniphilum]|uniref:Uncharacterized protein n=1 Tax=Mycobacteroides salmoniphilum TaxID=404941 RepID=A0A4R8SLL3_9MYCO|nr:hypothetical protein [Mycobacteroides salmoniphilum]TDZ98545.1 hypothetical protein CCUG60885_00415 [Mycobacteroides salmoniphilum]TEA03075.1 hypothetical protein CCUG60883_03699 [Mycobacteroides salmoniphilum]
MPDEQMTSPPAVTPPLPSVAPATDKPKWWRNPKIRTAIVVAGVVLAIVRIATAEKRQEHRADTAAHKEVATYAVGDCVTIGRTQGEKSDNISHADCAQDLSYTVGVKPAPGQTCPGTSYSAYTWTLHDSSTATLCLAANFTIGRCYRLSDDNHSLIEPADCTDPASFKVAQRLNDSTDATQCPPETTHIIYPQPSRVYCMEPPA